MILGRADHVHAAAFDEINAAVEALTDRPVVFNAHHFPAPPGSIVFNLENVPQQVDPARWAGHEVWDFSAINAAKYTAKFVPVGYHPSMTRITRRTPQYDVVFAGAMNERRQRVLDTIEANGYSVFVVPPACYGALRDEYLSRARLALNMLFYGDGVFPALRVAHLVANRIPVVSEFCQEHWHWVPHTTYEKLARAACLMLEKPDLWLAELAARCYARFRELPLTLPS